VTPDGLEGQFLPGREGPVFVLRRGPRRARATVVIVPPFAEEMNKTRRMLTLVAIRLAEHGVTTVLPDFYGTGDSGGDFVEAGIALWRDDLAQVLRWCGNDCGPVCGLLAVRLGCALIGDDAVLDCAPELQRSILWQPVFDGSKYATQFLRLRVAASMANGLTETVGELRRQAAETGEIEVAGYRISSRMLEEMELLRTPTRLSARLGPIDWHEVVRDLETGLPLPSQKLIEATQAAGGSVSPRAFTGEPFWCRPRSS